MYTGPGNQYSTRSVPLRSADPLRWHGYARSLAALEVPAVPSPEELMVARELLLELFCDFPFAHEADRAHALAMLLLPFVREKIEGPTPLHFVTGNATGVGCSLLVEQVSLIVSGEPALTLLPRSNDKELYLDLGAVLRLGPSLAVLDCPGSRGAFHGLAIPKTISSDTWVGQLPKLPDLLTLPNRTTWAFTTRIRSLSPALVACCLPLYLRSPVERPWLRRCSEFRHCPLKTWTLANRRALQRSALMCVQSWCAAGEPKAAVRLPGFERWSEVIGGILETACIPGFLGNLQAFHARFIRASRRRRG